MKKFFFIFVGMIIIFINYMLEGMFVYCGGFDGFKIGIIDKVGEFFVGIIVEKGMRVIIVVLNVDY